MGQHHRRDPLDELGRRLGHDRRHRPVAGDVGRHLDTGEGVERPVDRSVIAFEHQRAGSGVGLGDGGLDGRNGVVGAQHTGEGEEAGLQHGVHTTAETRLAGDPTGVDHPQLETLVEDLALDFARQRRPDVVGAVRGVEQHRGAGARHAEDVERLEEIGVMAGDEVGLADQIRGRDGFGSEPQVRDGHGTGLLRVVDEVALRIAIGLGPDDLHGVLVRADGAVAAQPVEDRPDDIIGFGPATLVDRQAGVGDVVDDADREVVLRRIGRELVEYRPHHRRGELLRRQAVAPADDPGHGVPTTFDQGSDHIGVQRLADRSGFLRAIEYGDRCRRGGQHCVEGLGVEGAVEPDPDDGDLLASRLRSLDGFDRGTEPRAHHHDDPVGVGCAPAFEQAVAAAGELEEPIHLAAHAVGHGEMEGVGGLACLEEHVGVLCRAPQDRAVRVETVEPMSFDQVVVDHRPHHVVADGGDGGDLVRGPEAVEEVQERHPGPQRRRVRDQGHVLGLLYRRCRQHRHAGLSAGHDVAVITEDAQRVRGQRPRRHVHDRRREFAGDLVQVGDHQQQALRCGEGRGQCPGLQRTVQGPGGARLALHLDDVGHRAPQVLDASLGPGVGQLTHR